MEFSKEQSIIEAMLFAAGREVDEKETNKECKRIHKWPR